MTRLDHAVNRRQHNTRCLNRIDATAEVEDKVLRDYYIFKIYVELVLLSHSVMSPKLGILVRRKHHDACLTRWATASINHSSFMRSA
jgi:hypothetical protein